MRETFALDVYGKPTLYKAENEINPYAFQPSKWKPSIFMPKEACRIFLKITDVRIERLQDISETDALKEGIDISKLSGDFEHTPTYEFKDLWEKINGKGSWELDPFVWVVSFENFKPE